MVAALPNNFPRSPLAATSAAMSLRVSEQIDRPKLSVARKLSTNTPVVIPEEK